MYFIPEYIFIFTDDCARQKLVITITFSVSFKIQESSFTNPSGAQLGNFERGAQVHLG